MRSTFLIAALAALSASVTALPFKEESQWEDSLPLVERSSPTTPITTCNQAPPPPPGSSPPAPGNRQNHKKSYLDFENQVASSGGACNVSRAMKWMDLTDVNPALPSPAATSTLFQVVIGRGTQNYTCDLSNQTAIPESVGALATLYDFSCVAAERPALLRHLTRIALDQPIPTTENTKIDVVNKLESGHHYFINSTTPFFNLDTATHQDGMGALYKANASDAPASAYPGVHGKGDGAVQWVRLLQTNFQQHHWSEVYRTHTAGGDPPKLCTGQQAAFEVPYAAIYWLFT